MKNSNYITVAAIAALGNQRQIGKDNELLWDIPADLQRFKELTTGKAVIMGRKTWQSLPEAVRPLPGRENIILTRNSDFAASGGVIKHEIKDAIDYAKKWSKENGRDEVFIIGGAAIYKQALPHTDKLYLTLVDSDLPGDTFFPEFKNKFREIGGGKINEGEVNFIFKNLEKK